MPQRQVDERDREIHAAAAAALHRISKHHRVPDRDTDLLRERGSHDDPGQTIAGSCGECLRRIPGHLRVVGELELVLAVERVNEGPLPIFGAKLARDMGTQVLLHIVIERKDIIGTDACRRGGEQVISKQTLGVQRAPA